MRNKLGFTLIEIIVTLIIAGIMTTMIITFMSRSVTNSIQPVVQSQQLYYLHQVMENIVADYNNLMATDSSPLDTLKNNIGNGNQNNSYGRYEVIENNFITIDSESVLKVKIKINDMSLANIFAG